MSERHIRPRRDVSAREKVGDCQYCGGNAHSLLGGEHIFKCSEVVSKSVLETFITCLETDERWRSEDGVDEETADEIARELRSILADGRQEVSTDA